ncbi:hypothetical protein FGM00_17130 [Aggregatimonas sangjinii]|uniref:Uncharacterized protein n=1 Tax=Aggregatimonas sangjinii TaxID=2583587 RepID=A0A5B7SYA7_9FLAO|nr:hypothetical protein [Aggregatimonas sangjinii]QCX01754.1 hypothetical protein FGM00_17130 [Aggregatimonas sangjinii]
MKILILICTLFLSCNRCSDNMEDVQGIDFVEYSAITRGSSFSCIIDSNQIVVEFQGDEPFLKRRKIMADEWKDICESVHKLNLEDIGQLQSSTALSASDRSRIANLVISVDEMEYESKAFDEGHPPDELRWVIDKIIALAKTVD